MWVAVELCSALGYQKNPKLGIPCFDRNAGSVPLILSVSPDTSQVNSKTPGKYPGLISSSSSVRKFNPEQTKSKDILNLPNSEKHNKEKCFFFSWKLCCFLAWLDIWCSPSIILERYSHLRGKALPGLLKLSEPLLWETSSSVSFPPMLFSSFSGMGFLTTLLEDRTVKTSHLPVLECALQAGKNGKSCPPWKRGRGKWGTL